MYTHIVVFFGRVGGCDRDEGQDGFLTGGGGRGLNGEKDRCDCICKMISLKICNNFKFE